MASTSPPTTCLEADSLFSLELVVDNLFIHKKIGCRFPAIAFRLLDFPTLMIYHVEPDLADSIKKKIAADPNYNLAPQLHELQDKNGCFPVKKGKSCLFRVAANTLLNHLTNTPLYVMVIDTFPETPKLLGNSTIGLDAAMESVYGDICKLGISVPSVHGEKSVYTIYNLMGVEIGKLALGFRLLSLGVGLLSHIPDHAVVKVGKKQPQLSSKKAAYLTNEPEDIVLEDLETVDKTVQVSISQGKAEPVMHGGTQTDMAFGSNDASVQTQKKFKKKKQTTKNTLEITTTESDEFGDFFVTNAVCPPPLYFNSEAEPKPSVQRIIQQSQQVCYADSDSDESLSTIRHEDKFSDSDIETAFEEKIAPPPQKLLSEKYPAKQTQQEVVSSWLNKERADTKKQLQPADLRSFPVLNALLQEIATLPGVQPGGLPHDLRVTAAQQTPHVRQQKSPRAKHVTQKTFEEQEAAVTRLASPRRAQAPPPDSVKAKGKQQSSTAAGTAEPKQKGWIRKEQVPVGVKKTKLTYGMTNTQRLRLAKGNPELLKTLEKSEEERVQKRRVEQLNKYPWLRREGGHMKLNTADISTEISKHPEADSSLVIPRLNLRQSDHDVGVSDEFRHPKKPVPTPRLSLSLTNKDKPLLTPRPRPHKPDRQNEGLADEHEYKAPEEQENSVSHSSRSKKSIEVHIPSSSAKDDDADSEATSLYESELDAEELDDKLGRTRTIHTPGFPQEPADTGRSSVARQYSDDFEDLSSAMGAEPVLRRVVENYSDSDSQPSVTGQAAVSAEDLGFRRVVDTYSDHTETEQSQRSDSKSFHSAQSGFSGSGHSTSTRSGGGNNQHLKATVPNLPSSTHSPITAESMHTRQPTSGMATREPIIGSSSTTDAHRDIGASYDTLALSNSALSVETSTSRNFEDQHGRSSPRRPKASPRRGIERVASLHTESISSYAPSEGDNMTPLSPGAEYSDSFEEDDDISDIFPEPGHVGDIKLAPEAKFGYTWT